MVKILRVVQGGNVVYFITYTTTLVNDLHKHDELRYDM